MPRHRYSAVDHCFIFPPFTQSRFNHLLISAFGKPVRPFFALLGGVFISATLFAPIKAWAACTPAVSSNTTVTCSGVVNSTVGAGPSNSNNVILNINNGTQIDVTDRVGISLGDNSTITLIGNAVVQNKTTLANPQGPWTAGANTVEFGSNNTLTIAKDASIIANGPVTNGEAINVIGASNTIINYGTISATSAAAIFYENRGVTITDAPQVIQNYGTISTAVPGGSVIGSAGSGNIHFTNRDGAIVQGNLRLSTGNDVLVLEAGSTITGSFDSGGGNDSLTLTDGTVHTDASLDGNIVNFDTISKNGNGQWTLNGNIGNSGGSALTLLVNQGALVLTADNRTTFLGTTQIGTEATLEARAYSLSPTVVNDGLLRFKQTTNEVYAGIISGGGAIQKDGLGLLTLTGENIYTGGTTISAGVLQIGNNGLTGSINGNIVNNDELRFNRSNNLNASNNISGNGIVTKYGNGVLTLSGTNIYSGGTVINAGTLAFAAGTALGSGSLTLNAGTTLENTAATSLANAVVLNGSSTVQTDANLGLSGIISGTGGFSKTGTGTLTLSGNNTYSGATTVSNGTLQAGAANV
ncbi:autotransporter-associated beta strand repeat-containing protein, partial [Neisseriaceae bacterium TC5R-5]|nr:autotransporter-associated beta strand repeat-containing protein [Neisseriaceae bacterium TC5R-5]